MSDDNDKRSIQLAEFIHQVKEDLLSVTPGKDNGSPFLFVESVELELQVTANRTSKASAKGNLKINVLGTGGEVRSELGRDSGQEKVQKIKVKLSPIFDKAQLVKSYQILHGDKMPDILQKSLVGILKGDDESNLNEDLGD
jgi:hypothetical protein